MGEQPIFTTTAHVFEIDPGTKRSWMPTSKQAVTVSFYCDPMRKHYRIISVDNSKAIINSSITPTMTFMKTSAKFGQWSDVRANTVYGLGFPSEGKLDEFAKMFTEMNNKLQNSVTNTNGYAQESTDNKIDLPSSRSDSPNIQRKYEAEVSNLKSNNEELTILLEKYKNENEKLQIKARMLEEQNDNLVAELRDMKVKQPKREGSKQSETVHKLTEELQRKSKIIEKLQKDSESYEVLEEENERLTAHCQDMKSENESLKAQLNRINTVGDDESLDARQVLKMKLMHDMLGIRINDLRNIHAEMTTLLNPQDYSC